MHFIAEQFDISYRNVLMANYVTLLVKIIVVQKITVRSKLFWKSRKPWNLNGTLT